MKAVFIAMGFSILPVAMSAQERDTSVAIETGTYAGTVVQIEKGSATRKGSRCCMP